ncbi:hypothetical protein CKO42_06255 [Lamprobacter modestohalophilus]|uniref:Uncharacterized protein n=1 Tax=Lamprobacter modestohalophilus TaxID=1064514 RepID=A0A9X0W6W8_9GAMM|nr:hypothetical protein [Lamprobacter modestohalophilus]
MGFAFEQPKGEREQPERVAFQEQQQGLDQQIGVDQADKCSLYRRSWNVQTEIRLINVVWKIARECAGKGADSLFPGTLCGG